jgi:hypothetical protein
MAEQSDRLREHFSRERRFLLVVSVILLAHELLGISVAKSVEALGLHLEIENPERLFWGVWIVWTWAFIRYLQLLYSLEPRSAYPLDRRTRAWNRLVEVILMRRVRKEARTAFDAEVPRSLQIDLRVEGAGREHKTINRAGRVEADNLWYVINVTRRWRDPVEPNPPLAVHMIGSSSRVRKDAGTWVSLKSGESVEGGVRQLSEGVRVPLTAISANKTLFFAAVVWNFTATTYATEYYIPVLVGAAPLLVQLPVLAKKAAIIVHSAVCHVW